VLNRGNIVTQAYT